MGDDFNSLNNVLKKFDDPFLLYSDAYFPANTTAALEMCRYLWHLVPKYRKASQRVARHFITDFDFPGDGDAREKEEFREFIQYQLRLKNVLIEAGDDERAFGNSFHRIHYPYDRFLEDRRGGSLVRYALSDFPPEDVKYHWKEMEYEIPDPKFKNPKENGRDKEGKIPKVRLSFIDRRNRDKERIKIRRIDPRHVSLFYSNINGEFQVLYRFPPYVDQMIKNNDIFQINRIPKDMLQAFSQGYDFLFHHNEVFHLKTPTISGISEYGWGLPDIIANFRDIHQYQIYRKADEAVGMDYVLPFRVISPEAGSGISDSIANVVMAKWSASVKTMIEQHRKDKTSIHGFPMPLTYQEFGGNAKQFSQKDQMEYHGNALLQAAGYPVELFESSLQIQQVPTTIRLFENSFWHLYDGYNALISWAVERITTYMGMESYDIVLQRPDLATILTSRICLFSWV